jgi:phosphatidylinositol glycan class B
VAGAAEAPRQSRAPAGGGERSVEEILGRSLRLLGALTLASALTSATFFHPDEQFQVVEFAGLKLGFTVPERLPWEYGARIRPWLQPALYTLLAKPLLALGVAHRAALLALFRVATGAASLAALAHLSRVAVRELPRESMRRAYAAWLPLFGFLPYLLVRTSSEALSGACLASAVAFAWDARAFTKRHAFACGALLGLAFEARFQSAFASLGLVAWVALVRRVPGSRLGALIAGGLGILAVAAFVDRWGYGAWCFPPLAYVRENVLHGVADSFGREPFWAYPVLVVVNVFGPSALLAVLALPVAAWRFPRHAIVWAAVPFFLAHTLVAHKEERFLFPLVFLVPALVALAFAGPEAKPRTTRIVRAALVASLPAMALHLVHPIGFRAQFRFVAEAAALPAGAVVRVPAGLDVPWYPFLAARTPMFAPLGVCAEEGALVYAEIPEPEPPALCSGAPARAVPVATDLVFGDHAALRAAATRFTRGWNGLRDRGAPLPWLRFATIVRVESAAR